MLKMRASEPKPFCHSTHASTIIRQPAPKLHNCVPLPNCGSSRCQRALCRVNAVARYSRAVPVSAISMFIFSGATRGRLHKNEISTHTAEKPLNTGCFCRHCAAAKANAYTASASVQPSRPNTSIGRETAWIKASSNTTDTPFLSHSALSSRRILAHAQYISMPLAAAINAPENEPFSSAPLSDSPALRSKSFSCDKAAKPYTPTAATRVCGCR